MKISKKDALMWFEFFAALPPEEELLPHQQEIALAALAIHRLVHRGDDGRCQRLRDIADAETDNLDIGIRLLVRGDTMCDFRKEVGGLDLRIVLVNV